MKLLEITWGVKMEHHNQSSYLGAPSFVIKKTYLEAVLNLLIAGTNRLKQKNVVKQICKSQKDRDHKTLEDDITIKLSDEINEIQKEQDDYKFRVDSFPCNFVHPQTNIKYSRIDIRFTWNNYRSEYLAVEAKLLYGTGSSRAGEYVEKGVMDFVNGTYSWGHTHGIMLGYILSEPIDKAISAVKEALKKRKDETNEISPMDKVDGIVNLVNNHETGTLLSSIMFVFIKIIRLIRPDFRVNYDYPLLFKSVHKQGNNGTKIILLHIFFDMTS
jgi:hypothetical protein